MLGKRTKHSFSFESFDNYTPYKIQESGIAKKTSVFSYSTEYFRKKQSSQNALYFVAGGNIPYNMTKSRSFTPVDLSNGKNIPPPIVCSLNTGSAHPIGIAKVFNLSPNKIPEEPCVCKRNPQYDALVQSGACVDGSECIQEITNPDGSTSSVSIPPEIYTDCTQSSEVIPEKGIDQKPNFLYFPTYQPSCSTHPRAAGYAHEDYYDTLKKNVFGAGNNDSRCCDYFCACLGSSLTTYFLRKYPNPNFTGKPGETIKDASGNVIPEYFLEFQSSCGPETTTFCCGENWRNDYRCTNYCDTGWYFSPGDGVYNLKICPPLNQNSDGSTNDDYEFPSDVQSLITELSAISGKEYTPEDFYPQSAYFSRTFLLSGNTNCGCGGQGGVVYYSGTMDCGDCTYFLPDSMYMPGWNGGIITIHSRKCESKSQDPKTVCGCIFNEEIDFGAGDKIYLTTLTYPSFRFPTGSILEIGTDGEIRARGCGDEFIYDCNDIN